MALSIGSDPTVLAHQVNTTTMDLTERVPISDDHSSATPVANTGQGLTRGLASQDAT
jgi:hypothetical protein